MTWTADDERRVVRALVNARSSLTSIGRDPVGADIVFVTLQWAVDVERRQRVRGPAPRMLKGAGMDYIRTPEEHEADFRQRIFEITCGADPNEVFGIFVQPSPQEVDTMESINTVFRACLVGPLQERDWKIVQLMAAPKAGARRTAKALGCTKAVVDDRKKLQCEAIWMRLRRLLPAISTGTGTVWKQAA